MSRLVSAYTLTPHSPASTRRHCVARALMVYAAALVRRGIPGVVHRVRASVVRGRDGLLGVHRREDQRGAWGRAPAAMAQDHTLGWLDRGLVRSHPVLVCGLFEQRHWWVGSSWSCTVWAAASGHRRVGRHRVLRLRLGSGAGSGVVGVGRGAVPGPRRRLRLRGSACVVLLFVGVFLGVVLGRAPRGPTGALGAGR
jgi:hypothetical protein